MILQSFLSHLTYTKIFLLQNFLNIIDVLAILPYFITFIITTIAVESSLKPQTATILRYFLFFSCNSVLNNKVNKI